MLLSDMRKAAVIIFGLTCFGNNLLGQDVEIVGIEKFQKELNEEYADSQKSPLSKTDIERFKGHEFFPINLKFRVTAILKLKPEASFFKMQTSNNQPRDHRIYAIASFMIDGRKYELSLYQSADLMKIEEYEDYLFLPFTDLTNGTQTYSAGRYIDLRIPKKGNEISIDFNKAYNPYCAYSRFYSCPIVPRENDLDIPIEAGIVYRRH
jgi:uncharacterized protein